MKKPRPRERESFSVRQPEPEAEESSHHSYRYDERFFTSQCDISFRVIPVNFVPIGRELGCEDPSFLHCSPPMSRRERIATTTTSTHASAIIFS